MVTAIEGYKMAKNGRAGAALATAAIGSFVAGTIATVLLSFVRTHGGGIRGAARTTRVLLPDGAGLHHRESAVLGASSSCAGSPPVPRSGRRARSASTRTHGQTRYSPDVPELLRRHRRGRGGGGSVRGGRGALQRAVAESRKARLHEHACAWAHEPRRLEAIAASLAARLGYRFPFGLHPGRGDRDPHLSDVRRAKKSSPKAAPAKFSPNGGPGAIEGVAGPKAANNAAVTGTLVALLTLGISTVGDGGHTAGGLPELHPPARPDAVQDSAALVWTLIASLYIGNVMLLGAERGAGGHLEPDRCGSRSRCSTAAS